MSKLSIIVAVASNGAIGKGNDLLWHISDDLKRFKKLTSGNTIIMGRKTFESLPGGPLPNREHIILTRDKSYKVPGCFVTGSIDDVLRKCDEEKENFVIGGGEIYRLFMPYCTKMYLTRVDKSFEADTFFPEVDFEIWKADFESDKMKDDRSGIEYQYVNFIRK